jgi:glycerol-1-phosphate dehydrogenase [NAD(P)+]
MTAPQVFVFDESDRHDDAAAHLAAGIAELGIERPWALCSTHGERLAAALDGPRRIPKTGADQVWAERFGSSAHRGGADAIVAVGGGRCLDIGKLAAARAGLVVVSVPTQLSHDGICSPVAVVPDRHGRAESVGAVAPRAAFLSLPVLMGAPRTSAYAGVGDLLANPLALRDWALAVDSGVAEANARAWDLSVESYRRIEKYLDDDGDRLARDANFLLDLGDALVLSGVAMIEAGSSRPASGAEHEISHAIDEVFGGRALHGAQVALGCVVSLALYGEDTESFRRRLARLGLPQHPGDLGLTENDFVTVLLEAPGTRPGRFTILEEADLDAAKARALVRRIWPE